MDISAWFSAVEKGNLSHVLKAIKTMKGQRDESGATALMIATRLGHMHLVILLAQHEAGFVDNNGRSALLEAVVRLNLSFVRVLGRLEFDLLLGQDKRYTALDAALSMDPFDKGVTLELISIQGCQYDSLGRSSLQVILGSPRREIAISALQIVRYLPDQLTNALAWCVEKDPNSAVTRELQNTLQSPERLSSPIPANRFTSTPILGMPHVSLQTSPVGRSFSAEVPRSRKHSRRTDAIEETNAITVPDVVLTTPLIRNPPALPPLPLLMTAKTNTRIAELEAQVAELEKKLDASRLSYTKQTSQLLDLTRAKREKVETVEASTSPDEVIESTIDACIQTQFCTATVSVHSQTYTVTSDASITTEECILAPHTHKSEPSPTATQQSPEYVGIKTTSFYGSESPTSVDVSPRFPQQPDSSAWSYVVVTIDLPSENYVFQLVSMDKACLTSPLTPSFTEVASNSILKLDYAGRQESLTPLSVYEDPVHNDLVAAVLAHDLERIQQLSNLYGQQDRSGKTALMYAAEIGYEEAIPLLAPKEAGMLRKCGRYLLPGTALMHAVVHGHEKCARLLVNYKGEIGAKTKYGWTALMFATVQNHIQLVQLLAPLEARMVTSSDFLVDQYCNGNTALLMAVKLNHNDIVRILAPYEFDIKDSRGLSADLLSRDSSLRSYLRTLTKSL